MERVFQNGHYTSPVLFILLFTLTATHAETVLPDISGKQHIQETSVSTASQERSRKKIIQPAAPEARSKLQGTTIKKLYFPVEKNCYFIDKVTLKVDSSKLKLNNTYYFTQQAQGKCLGVQGIRLLAKTLQDEIIRLGYITTRINIQNQDLHSRELKFEITSGKVGNIIVDKSGADHINLATTLPLKHGDILTLRDLEQGSFNLQRVPGSSVKINLVPGKESGESDIYIYREQDKFWQVRAWANDAGAKATGRYQAGAALYLNNLSSLSDTFYFSYGHDLAKGHTVQGNSNRSVGYTLPWGYWWLDLYASQSRYQQHVRGNWSDWMLNNDNAWYSAQLNRVLSRTVGQKTTAGLQIFNNGSRYYFNSLELTSMRKKSAGWKAVLQQQRSFGNSVVIGTVSFQKKRPWFGSNNTPEQQLNLIDRAGRLFLLDLQASVNFNLSGQWFNYAPHFALQLTPDRLSSLDSFSLGNRWTVRGFDGESSLQENKGWYWRNDFNWIFPERNYRPYIGIDMGQVTEKSKQKYYGGRTIAGSVAGLRGEYRQVSYDLFAGLPLVKPEGFHTAPLTLGFSLQWQY